MARSSKRGGGVTVAAGRRIAKLREALGLTQEDVAAAVGVTRGTIAGIETGKDQGGIATIIALADEFKVPLDWLLDRRVPPGGPLVGKFLEDPDKLALIQFWEDRSEAERNALALLWRLDRAARGA